MKKSEMYCFPYIYCTVFILFGVLFDGTHCYNAWPNSQVQTVPVDSVDIIIDEYLLREKTLWNMIRSNGDNPNRANYAIYEAHQKFMGKNFGEIDIFKRVARELSLANRSVIENIATVNIKFDQGYALLKHEWQDQMPLFTSDVLQTLQFATNEVKAAILDEPFWNAVVNVCLYNSILYSVGSEISVSCRLGNIVADIRFMFWPKLKCSMKSTRN